MRPRRMIGDRNLVGKNITQLRIDKQIGQGELLSKIHLHGVDMNQSKLSRIESQRIAVADRDLYAIARALNVAVDDLFTYDHLNEAKKKQGIYSLEFGDGL